jgi:hypothetical protein
MKSYAQYWYLYAVRTGVYSHFDVGFVECLKQNAIRGNSNGESSFGSHTFLFFGKSIFQSYKL